MYKVNPYTNIKQDKNMHNHQAQISKGVKPFNTAQAKKGIRLGQDGIVDHSVSLSLYRYQIPEQEIMIIITLLEWYTLWKKEHYTIQTTETIIGIHKLTTPYSITKQTTETIIGIHKLTTPYSITIQTTETINTINKHYAWTHIISQDKLQKQS